MKKFVYGKNVFLTGGSSGIGLATAELFAANGYTVFAGSRNPSSEVRTFPGGGEIRPVKLDVCNPGSIASAAEFVLAQADIGIVIHCAGIGIACAAEDYPPGAVLNLMNTNFNGVLRLNSRLLPFLRGRGAGLCVMVGSMAGIFSVPYQSHYSASKAAIASYASALRMELNKTSVRVCLIMPGDTRTGFTNARKYEIDESSPFYDDCIKAIKKMEKDEINGHPPSKVAQTIFKISAKKNPPSKKIIGIGYKTLALLNRLLPVRLVEYILRKMYVG